jgi:hypothetical protein
MTTTTWSPGPARKTERPKPAPAPRVHPAAAAPEPPKPVRTSKPPRAIRCNAAEYAPRTVMDRISNIRFVRMADPEDLRAAVIRQSRVAEDLFAHLHPSERITGANMRGCFCFLAGMLCGNLTLHAIGSYIINGDHQWTSRSAWHSRDAFAKAMNRDRRLVAYVHRVLDDLYGKGEGQ